jgi:tight adherence protein C
MIVYLIIFAYYLFMCFVIFYFLNKRSYYRYGQSKIKNNGIKVIINKLVNRVDSISYRIGSSLIHKKYFSINKRNKELIGLLKFGSKINLTPESFTGYKVILFLLLAMAGFFAGNSSASSSAAAMAAGLSGYFIPDIMLSGFNHNRRRQIERDLPDIIDLLAVATFSGQNIYNAIRIVISKYKGSICTELSNFIEDIDIGTGKLQAYRNLIERSDSPEFKNFISLLIQSEKYGASINDILKRKSDYIKFKSYQELEREIRKKSVLILFPLVFLILPSFIILVGGPLIYLMGGDFFVF